MGMKKGIFFTIDALLASSIIIISILLIANFYAVEEKKVSSNYASRDLVRVYSTLTVGQVNNNYVKSLISSGDITYTNNTVLEQIGDFWANDRLDLARNLAANLTEGLFPPQYGFSILVNGEEIYSRNIPTTKSLVSSREIVTGIAKAKPTQGYTGRVLLNGIKSKKTSSYAYFGGYEGDGTITKKLFLPNNIISFNSSYIEVDAGGDFNLFINNIFSGSYAQGSSGGGFMQADKWNISNVYLSNFKQGENTFNLVFTSGQSYVAGGFLKVTYATTSLNATQTPGYERYYFPGIDGFNNLYSSIYVPGPLNNLQIYLNYTSNYTTYLKLGNTTVYVDAPNGTKNITLTNDTLKTLLDYNSFNQKTIPVRLSLANVTSVGGNADAVLVSDVSGSMDWCSRAGNQTSGLLTVNNNKGCIFASGFWFWKNLTFDYPYFLGYSNYNRTFWKNNTNDNKDVCGCRYHTTCIANDTRKMNFYINSSLQFTNSLLNVPNNNVGLVEFSSNYSSVYITNCSSTSNLTTPFPGSIVRINNLTSNKQQLIDKINTTESYWETCTCCGINKAVNILQAQSSPLRKKYIILMSDGEANLNCTYTNATPVAQAVQSAWDACNLGISVYTIAFGNDANATTMQRMNCSGGKFFNATDTTKLLQAYEDIAGEINALSFVEQAINVTGGVARSLLYPNSYIEYNYSIADSSFNQIPLNFETDRFGNNASTGTLTVYPNTTVADAKVTSYSSSRWTDKLVVNDNIVYRLGDFGQNYQSLGDPFVVNIPISSLSTGSNSIAISTGLNSTYSTNGSSDDRVIYTLLLKGASDYSSVVSKSSGCSWYVNFEDGTSATIKVPSGYSGSGACSFSGKTYDQNDSLNLAVYELFSNLDIDKDGKLDVNIDESNLNFNTLTISNVPSLWGPAIIEIRVWE